MLIRMHLILKRFFMEYCGGRQPGCVPLGKVVSVGGIKILNWPNSRVGPWLCLVLADYNWTTHLTTQSSIFWSAKCKWIIPYLTANALKLKATPQTPGTGIHKHCASPSSCMSTFWLLCIQKLVEGDIQIRRVEEEEKEKENTSIKLVCPDNGRPVVQGSWTSHFHLQIKTPGKYQPQSLNYQVFQFIKLFFSPVANVWGCGG